MTQEPEHVSRTCCTQEPGGAVGGVLYGIAKRLTNDRFGGENIEPTTNMEETAGPRNGFTKSKTKRKKNLKMGDRLNTRGGTK